MAIDTSECIPVDDRIRALDEAIDNVSTGNEITLLEEGTPVGTFHTINVVGVLSTVTDEGSGVAKLEITGSAGSQNLFETIVVSANGGGASGDPVVADSTTDTLNLEAGDHILIESTAGSDIIRFSLYELYTFFTITVDGEDNVFAESSQDTIEFEAGTGMAITTDNTLGSKKITFTNTDPGGGGGGGGGHNGGRGVLVTDLTVDMDEVEITVGGHVGSDPGATVTAKNPPDPLHDDAPNKWLFMGNAGGWVEWTEYDDGIFITDCQPPLVRPVEP